ncbi:hypothetical protein BN871_AB_00610 [Paenibacillus sp. P22]|nr:hypothetical protein BN871_AB_00610 [Paenibacillus sp. P22]
MSRDACAAADPAVPKAKKRTSASGASSILLPLAWIGSCDAAATS